MHYLSLWQAMLRWLEVNLLTHTTFLASEVAKLLALQAEDALAAPATAPAAAP